MLRFASVFALVLVSTVLFCACREALAQQVVDAGPDSSGDAGDFDAGDFGDAGPINLDGGSFDGGLEASDAGGSLTEEEVKARAHQLQEEEATREREAADKARSDAKDLQDRASTEAGLRIPGRIAELEETRAAQATYQIGLVRNRKKLDEHAAVHKQLVTDVLSGEPMIGSADPRFEELSASLAGVRTRGLERVRGTLRKVASAPRPPPIDDETARVLDTGDLKRLENIAAELRQKANELEAKARADVQAESAYYFQQSLTLTAALTSSLEASPALRSDLRALDQETARELGGEAVQLALRTAYWARTRLGQLRNLTETISYSQLASILWTLAKLILLLLIAIWAHRRWDAWMQILIEEVGKTLTYGQSALFLVRLAESAKKFGPPLLVLLAALASYRVFSTFSPEVRLGLALTITMSALSVQRRLVESVCDQLHRRRLERSRERELLAADQAELAATVDEPGTADESSSKPAVDANGADLEPFWLLFSKTWRRLTSYVAVVAVLLVITHFMIGRGVFYGVAVRWAWLLTIPLTLFFLRTWRARIVHELTVRSQGGETTLLSRLAERHSNRFYGVFIVFAAFIVVLGRRSAAFVRDHFFGLNSTKRALAFLFRRRVQKHAEQHGRVLEKPHPLPDAVTKPFEDIGPALGAAKSTVPGEIKEAYERWSELGTDGSVALVGESGMGKSGVINKLSGILETEVHHLRLEDKMTRPANLFRWLAKELELEGELVREHQLIAALRSKGPTVISIDNCQHLFLRKVGGFDAWESFVRIVNECGAHVFWVLGFGKAAWDYLVNVGGRVAYFRKVVKMPEWTETELRRLILGRMRKTGYKVNFSDLLVTRLEGVQLKSQVIRTSQGYFRLLWDYSKGNPTIACHFWLRSLVPQDSGRAVRVHLFAAPQIEELEKLPDDIAFALTAIVEHESANVAELAEITNLPLPMCRFAVRYGRERGYLEQSGKRIAISPLWRHTIMTYLKRKHLLYS